MRDLKHLIAFENLLQETNNELVRQGKADGKRALGYTCYFMPEDRPRCYLKKWSKMVITGRTFDNGVLCTCGRT